MKRAELYLYSPYGPYDLYRASVPVKGFTLPFTSIIAQSLELPTLEGLATYNEGLLHTSL
jgi:hypothetical protein